MRRVHASELLFEVWLSPAASTLSAKSTVKSSLPNRKSRDSGA